MMVQLQQAVFTASPYQFPYLLISFQVGGEKKIEPIRYIASTEKRFRIVPNFYDRTVVDFVCKSGMVKLQPMFIDEKLQMSVTSIIKNVSRIYTFLFELNNKDKILCTDASDGEINVTGKKVTIVFDLGVLYIWIKAGILHMVYNESPISPNEFASLKDEVNKCVG